MRDFLNGQAIRVRVGRQNETDIQKNSEFFLLCAGYGLTWADGTRPTRNHMPTDGPLYRFISINPMSGDMISSIRPPREGFKDVDYVKPLQHNFGQFIRGDFWLRVRRNEIGEFLEIATRSKLLWANGMPPRAGMKGRSVPKEGMTVMTVRHRSGEFRIATCAPEFFEGTCKPIVDFHYIPRKYEVACSSTLDAVRNAARAVAEAAAATVKVKMVLGITGQSAQQRPTNIATESQSILITSNMGSPFTNAAHGKIGGTPTAKAKTRCMDKDTFSFSTGAIVALAELFGPEEWRKGAAEVERMYARREDPSAAAEQLRQARWKTVLAEIEHVARRPK
jgi:hypothetical protein